jgi:hypothetical protein
MSEVGERLPLPVLPLAAEGPSLPLLPLLPSLCSRDERVGRLPRPVPVLSIGVLSIQVAGISLDSRLF